MMDIFFQSQPKRDRENGKNGVNGSVCDDRTPIPAYLRIRLFYESSITLFDNRHMLWSSLKTFLMHHNCASRCTRKNEPEIAQSPIRINLKNLRGIMDENVPITARMRPKNAKNNPIKLVANTPVNRSSSS
jgi:hypothetical protein